MGHIPDFMREDAASTVIIRKPQQAKASVIGTVVLTTIAVVIGLLLLDIYLRL